MNDPTPQAINHDNVADLYDIYVRADFDIPFWLDQAHTVEGKTVELMCGTGRVSVPLLQAGVNLTCVDYAPGMLAQLERKLTANHLSCPVYCQDIVHLNLPERFDLAFVPFHSFAEIIDPARQEQALVQIRSHLRQNGKFVCPLHNPQVRKTSIDGKTHQIGEFPLPKGGLLSVRATMVFNPSTHIASGEQVYELFSPNQLLLERRRLPVDFYLFEKAQFEQLAIDTGFTVEAVYGDYDCSQFTEATSPFMIWALRASETRKAMIKKRSIIDETVTGLSDHWVMKQSEILNKLTQAPGVWRHPSSRNTTVW